MIHLTLVPYLNAAGELKTTPTQSAVKSRREVGVQPDILVCRTEHPLDESIKRKIALFCNVDTSSVIESLDASSIYEVPILMQKEKLDEVVIEKLGLESNVEPQMDKWNEFLKRVQNPKSKITVGLVGKYIELKDSYKSIVESFVHAGTFHECEVELDWIHSDKITQENVAQHLEGLDGVLVAPGFGSRGIKGKILAIQYVRENKIPFFGICLGMQCAVIEFARNVLGWKEAHTTEISEDCQKPVITIMDDQKTIVDKGGTMRLGAYKCKLVDGSKASNSYNEEIVKERHRHRYECNSE